MTNISALGALVIVAIAVLPGLPGETCYRLFVGGDSREETWSRVLRLIGFSVFGLVLYVVSTRLLPVPFPPYLLPGFAQGLTPSIAYAAAFALLGHFVGAAVTGVMAAFAMRVLDHFTSRTVHGSAWEHFTSVNIQRRWIVVGLQNGDSYAGYVGIIDSKLQSTDRDLTLTEPARYDPEKKQYTATEYQTLFLPGSIVSSIATVYKPGEDKRITTPGENIFVAEAK